MEKIIPYGKDNDIFIVCRADAGYGKRIFPANKAEPEAERRSG
jgi:hypothetical protein